MPIKNIIFDFGGVLIDWNPRYFYKVVTTVGTLFMLNNYGSLLFLTGNSMVGFHCF
jgi:FMN phosphatase YigB (HAD superfamily)